MAPVRNFLLLLYYFHSYCSSILSVSVSVLTLTSWYVCGGQRVSWFSPPTVCVPRDQTQIIRLGGKHLYLLSHFARPSPVSLPELTACLFCTPKGSCWLYPHRLSLHSLFTDQSAGQFQEAPRPVIESSILGHQRLEGATFLVSMTSCT